MTTCDTCKRPVWKADLGRRNEEEWCFERPNLTCRMIALGYQRGLLDGCRGMLRSICHFLANAGTRKLLMRFCATSTRTARRRRRRRAHERGRRQAQAQAR